MLLRGLDMHAAMQQTTTAAQAFSVLSWKGSLSYRADRFVTGDDVRVEGEGERRQVVATGEIGEVTYARRGGAGRRLSRPRPAWRGSRHGPVSAELARVGEVKPVDAFTMTPTAAMTWVDAGASHLDPGAYTASVLLPRGTTLEHVEVAPPCLMPIEPPGGLEGHRRAAVRARRGDDGPGPRQGIRAAAGRRADRSSTPRSSTRRRARRPSAASAGLEQSIKGGTGGRAPSSSWTLPEAGPLHALRVRPQGRRPELDGGLLPQGGGLRRPGRAGPTSPQWRPVLTAQFAAGRHAFSVLLAPGAVIQRVRVERKKDSPADYVATLRRLGFDVGPPGPMPRDRAVDAMRFLEKKAAPMKEARCGDVVLPTRSRARARGSKWRRSPGPGASRDPIAGPGLPPFGGGPLVPARRSAGRSARRGSRHRRGPAPPSLRRRRSRGIADRARRPCTGAALTRRRRCRRPRRSRRRPRRTPVQPVPSPSP